MPAYLAVLLAAVFFGTTGTAQALAAVDASPLAVGATRALLGGVLLAAMALRGRRAPGRTVPTTGRTSALLLAVVGGLGVVAYQPTFFLGTRMNGVAIGTAIALGSAPILTGLADGLIHRALPGRRWAIATALVVCGVCLVGDLPGYLVGGIGAIHPLGLAASAGAGACYALYTLTSKAMMERGWPSDAAIGAGFGAAAVFSIPVLLLAGTSWLATPAGIGLALWLGVVTMALANGLFGWGLSRLPAPTVSTLTIVEPLTATLLGVLVLRESLSATAVVGMVLLVAGILVLTLRRPVARRTGHGAVMSR